LKRHTQQQGGHQDHNRLPTQHGQWRDLRMFLPPMPRLLAREGLEILVV
jgi:hypothetical protein